MNWADLRLRLRALVFRNRMEQELRREVDFHLDMMVRKNVARGMSLEEARRQAAIKFGSSPATLESCRDERGVSLVYGLGTDIRYAFRQFRRSPAFVAVCVLSLACGIGANTAIFSLVNAVLLRPVAFPEPDRLVAVFSVNPAPGGGLWSVAPADYRDWREQSRAFENLAAYSGGELFIRLDDRMESLPGARVTSSFFKTFDVQPMLGRGFEPDDELNPPSTIVLSHRLWQSRFGGDPSIVGKQIPTDSGSVTVVGVMPPQFTFPNSADVWMPMGCCGEMTRRATRYWQTVGRLRAGQSIEAAQAEMHSIARRLEALYPKDSRGWSVQVMPFEKAMVRDVREALWILMGAVAFVIVIACANVAGLVLARSVSRRREVMTRLALGAHRWRIVRQLFVEGLLISLFGTVAGLLLARWGIGAFFDVLPNTAFTSLNRFRERVTLDSTVLLFTVAISMFTAVVLTLTPVWDSLKAGLIESIRATGPGTQTRREHRLYRLLVMGQFACAIVLLAGAGLLVQSFVRMLKVDYGYDPRGLTIVGLPQPAQNREAFVAQTLERIHATPGVESAAVMSFGFFGQLNFPFNIDGTPFPNGDVTVRYSSVTPEYFKVLKSRLIAGRRFDARDSRDAPGVAIINEKLARQYFSDRDPIGRTIVLAYNNQRMPRAIIGVTSDVRQDGPGDPIKPEILVPWAQLPWMAATLVIRAEGEQPVSQKLLQEAIWSVDKNLPPARARTVEDILSSQVATPRLYMILVGVFSAMAMALAAVGIYGLFASIVTRRRNEMAIRVTMGARRANILWMLIGEGIRLSAAGIVLGLLGAVALARLMRSLLYEVSPTDPLTLGSGTVLLLTVALVACYIPARRATQTDPMVALRHE
jgi:predicted permease